ncbi:MAG: hypothetical protein AB7P69_03770 [Candidatus Binatia bacterium]
MTRDATITIAIQLHPGLEDALCALSYYRHRHDREPLYKRSKSAVRLVSHARLYRRQARDYIRAARAKGFRGSIRAALTSPRSGAEGKGQCASI